MDFLGQIPSVDGTWILEICRCLLYPFVILCSHMCIYIYIHDLNVYDVLCIYIYTWYEYMYVYIYIYAWYVFVTFNIYDTNDTMCRFASAHCLKWFINCHISGSAPQLTAPRGEPGWLWFRITKLVNIPPITMVCGCLWMFNDIYGVQLWSIM